MDSTLSPVSHQNATRVRKISWHELHKIRFLCHGSGTAIYSANLAASHETSADVPVVLKTARCGLSGNDLSNVRAELKHEAECLSQLDHPNIIKMYGWGTIPSSATVCAVDTAFIDTPIPWSEFFLVLEPLVGGILSDRLQTNIANNGHGVQSNYRQPPPPPGPYVQRLFADVSPKSVAAFPKVDSEELFGPPSPPSSRIGTKPLTYIEVLIFAEQLAGALHYMHAQMGGRICILHRDLKPDNIGFSAPLEESSSSFISTNDMENDIYKYEPGCQYQGTAKQNCDSYLPSRLVLFDLGLAKMIPRQVILPARHRSNRIPGASVAVSALSAQPGGLEAEIMMKGGHGDTRERVPLPRYCLTGQTGSVRYMAPEVSLGKPYNQAVDVYSFSMVLWEMLHMKKPYFGMNVETHRQQVCRMNVRPETAHVSLALKTLLEQCWSSDIDERPSFADILLRLREIRAEAIQSAANMEAIDAPGSGESSNGA